MSTFLDSNEIRSLALLQTDFYRTEDEVLKSAQDFLATSSIGGQKSGAIIKGVRPISTSSLKSGNNCENNLYVVDISSSKGEGFMIASADKRTEPILSFSEDGHIDDTTFNAGLNIFLQRAEAYIELEKLKLEKLQDSVFESAKNKILQQLPDIIKADMKANDTRKSGGYYWVFNSVTPDYTLVEEIKPLTTTTWGGGFPYNLSCPYKSCTGTAQTPNVKGICPVGCAAVAIGQIMGYHKAPSMYDWESVMYAKNYTELTNPSHIHYLAAILYNLGIISNSSYTCKGSEASIHDVYNTFHALGYSTDGIAPYYWNFIYISLINNCPIYVRGENWPYIQPSHAWVIDGFRFYDRYVTNYATLYYNGLMIQQYISITYDPLAMVNCNYGWDGRDNGLYINKVFDCEVGPYWNKNYDELDDKYLNKLYTITNIRPR